MTEQMQSTRLQRRTVLRGAAWSPGAFTLPSVTFTAAATGNLTFAHRFTVSAGTRAANEDLVVRQPSFTNCAS